MLKSEYSVCMTLINTAHYILFLTAVMEINDKKENIFFQNLQYELTRLVGVNRVLASLVA